MTTENNGTPQLDDAIKARNRAEFERLQSMGPDALRAAALEAADKLEREGNAPMAAMLRKQLEAKPANAAPVTPGNIPTVPTARPWVPRVVDAGFAAAGAALGAMQQPGQSSAALSELVGHVRNLHGQMVSVNAQQAEHLRALQHVMTENTQLRAAVNHLHNTHGATLGELTTMVRELHAGLTGKNNG